MKIKVNPHTLEIQKDLVNEREIDITKCEFEFSEEITQEYVKEAYFTFEGTSYKEIIINNQCNIPNEVLAKKGQIEIGVVAYLVESEEEIKRYNPSPAYFSTLQGSLKDNAENSEPITPSEMEQFEQALQDGINQIANIDINAEETETGGIVEVTNKDGETTTITLTNGVDGEPGPQGIQGPIGPQGPQGIQGIQGERGPQGEKGSKGDKGDKGNTGATGQDGADGRDAKINGVNTLTIEAGSNINIEQEGSTMTISATGGSGGTSDYSDLSNKPKINNVELSGNKTTSDLGINIPDVSNFITKDVDDLTYYTKSSNLSSVATSGSYNDLTNKPTIPVVPSNISAFTNDVGYITDYTETDPVFSASPSASITNSDITTWNGKQDALESGTNIKTINNSSILGSGNLTIDDIKMLDVTNNDTQANALNYDTLTKGVYVLYNTSQTIDSNHFIYLKTSNDTQASANNSICTRNGTLLIVAKNWNEAISNNDTLGIVKNLLTSPYDTDTYFYDYTIKKNISSNALSVRTVIETFLTSRNYNSIGTNYDSTKTQYLKNVSGTISWVEEASSTPTMIYKGKINLYDSSAKALDLSNYPASTRIVLKNNDSTRSFYIKIGSNTAQVSLTTDNDESIINNIFYVDINSISGNTASIAVVWASTYQWCPIVTNTVMINFTNNGATVGTITRNMQGYALFQLEEDSNGDLSTTTLQEFVNIRTATFSKTRAPQRPAIHYFDKDKNSCLLSFTSQTSGSQQVYEGVMTTKQPNVNGFYETYKVRLELNYSGTTYSNHVLTKTKIGYVLDGEVEEKDMVVTYSDNTTETVKLVVYK